MPLRKLIYTLMEGKERDITKTELASMINVHPSTITNFFEYKTELKFELILEIIRKTKPEKELELMKEAIGIIAKSSKRLRDIRLSMEYLSTNRLLDDLKNVIETQINSSNKELKDWATHYLILYKYQTLSESFANLLKELKTMKPTLYIEMKVLRIILELYLNFMQRNYTDLFPLCEKAQKLISEIKCDFIRESYKIRISEMLSKGYLFCKDDPIEARKHGENILKSKNICASIKLNTYHMMGTSLIFDNFEDSARYFKKYKEMAEIHGRIEKVKEAEERDLHFLRVLWGKELELAQTTDPNEKMFYETLHGDKKKAIEMLKDCYDSPFKVCYEGIAKEDPELLVQSIAMFLDRGNKFFVRLPRMFLERISPEKCKTVDIFIKTINVA
jgi:hypothetical protein